MKLHVVIAESALELVPKEVRRSRAVVNDAKRRRKEASEILLDRSFHHSAMMKLREEFKRGRPDLLHVTALSVTGTPLYAAGLAKVYFHTRDDWILEVGERTRLPKSYFRFRNLIEKLLVEGKSSELVKVYRGQVRDLVRKVIRPDQVVGLSTHGEFTELGSLARELAQRRNPCVVIGGFPHGHFSESTLAVIDALVRIHRDSLDAHVAASRLVYEVELASQGENQ